MNDFHPPCLHALFVVGGPVTGVGTSVVPLTAILEMSADPSTSTITQASVIVPVGKGT